LSLKEVKY